jgi:putative component of toxin-antitoxin plasmid stabilization module
MKDGVEIVPTPWYDAELIALPGPDKERVERRLKGLSAAGWGSSMADGRIKHLRDGIHEVRILGRGAAYRVLFFVAPGVAVRVVVLTTCAAKSLMKKRHAIDAELRRALDRRAWWMEQHKQEEKDERV